MAGFTQFKSGRGGVSPLCFFTRWGWYAVCLALFSLFVAIPAYSAIPIEDSINKPLNPIRETFNNKIDDKTALDGKEPDNLDAIEKESEKYILHNFLGVEFYRDGQYEKAIEEFKKSVKLKEDFAEGYNNIGLVYFRLSRLDEAKAAFEQAVKHDRNSFEAHNNIGSVYLDQGDYDTALKYFYIAKELSDGNETLEKNIAQAFEFKEKRLFYIKLLIASFALGMVFIIARRAF